MIPHWMSTVARKAGLPSADRLALSRDMSLLDVWTRTCDVCGVHPHDLAAAVASTFSMDVIDIEGAEPTAAKLLPESVARKYCLFPVRDENRYLVVATPNPVDPYADQEVGFSSGRLPRFAVAPPNQIVGAIDSTYSTEQTVATMLARFGASDKDFAVEIEEDEQGDEELPDASLASGPVVQLANVILSNAVEARASDIHIQPIAAGGVVRFRTDGVLHNALQLPLPVLSRVISRIKIMAKLDITDRLRPQDGRTRVSIDGRKYDLRVSTVPTRTAEKAVIRILDPKSGEGLAETRIAAPEIDKLRRALTNRDGIIVVTGPTGSGKTTTLYGALREIATEHVNIMTVEDPVEYELPGLTQIQVEPKQGVTFASALRSILRQDPDVIFVGEIRDAETAEIAARASLTGHLVLSTLHTNDAVGAIHRLLDLGLTAGTVSETLRGALAQRLVRRVCIRCAEPVEGRLTSEEASLAEKFQVRPSVRARGCDTCSGHGYLGRLPVTEFLTPSPELVALVLADAPPHELRRQAVRDGMVTLLQSAIERVRAGETTLQELERVIGEADEPEHEASVAVGAPIATSSASPPAPRAVEALAPASSDRARRADAVVDAGAGLAVDQPHVLVVDDDGTTRAIARGVLEVAGCRVSEATDGFEALTLLSSEVYSLVLLDLDMPGVGGREVLRSVRSAMSTAGLPVVILTGSPDRGTEIELMEMGADDYLRKPIDARLLAIRVKAAMRRAQG